MARLDTKPGYRVFYQFLIVGYGFLVALAGMLLKGGVAPVAILSLQCLSLVFVVPLYFWARPREASWSGRFARQALRFLYPGGLVGAGAAAALLTSLVSPLPAGRMLLASLFALTFGIFLAGVFCAARAVLGVALSQVVALAAGLLMVSTPYYVNPFILATSGALRMRVVQAAVSINPLLVGAAGVLRFDWLRSPHLYQTCLIGGYQYPFYYPSALKIGIILTVMGIILMAASAFRKADKGEMHS